jgi:hypothetical protein
MDEGAIVLVRCAGANIPRATARMLQAVIISDLRQATFSRKQRGPHLLICDEAQSLFRSKYLRDTMAELLCMARSFGVHGLLITQNLASAVQDSEILETVHTNTRWSLILRGSTKDAGFMQTAFPLSGRMLKPQSNPYSPPEMYSLNEERNVMLQAVAFLPDREGWLWMKALSGEALRLRTRTVDIPNDVTFHDTVEQIRRDPAIGRRSSHASYLEKKARRDTTWRPSSDIRAPDDIANDLAELYQADEETNL